jgi:uncharacterized protein Yka (UPF0111/DUF47 family)
MQTLRKTTTGLMVGALIASTLLLFSMPLSAVTPENPEITQLLTDARDKAAELSRDADDMESMIRSDVSWQSHADMLELIRTHVNQLGKIAAQLEQRRGEASPWQQQAIDRMLPVLRELAANTTAAINHLNENKTRPLQTSSYPQYLSENAQAAHNLSDMISSFVKYGDSRAKVEKLEQKLEIASR